MPPRSPRPDLVAWFLIGVLAAVSMAVARGEIAESHSWIDRATSQAANVRVGSVHGSWLFGAHPVPNRYWSPWPPWAFRATDLMERGVEVAQVGLLVLGVGLCQRANRPVAARGLIPPRRQRPGPGRIAAIIATATMTLVTLGALRRIAFDPLSGVQAALVGPRAAQPFWPDVREAAAAILPTAIAAAWIYLAISCQYRRPPRDPIDRLGRWLGWAWIGTGAALKLVEVVGLATRSPS